MEAVGRYAVAMLMVVALLVAVGCAEQPQAAGENPAPATGGEAEAASAASQPRPADVVQRPAGDATDEDEAASYATTVLAGGCFWCVELVFQQLEGVVEVTSGYAGGSAATANYDDVVTGRTDHAEAVKVVYDPNVITYEGLLRVHLATHDPTQLNRQGPDVGRHYRSAIFYVDEAERAVAERVIAELEAAGRFDDPIVTTLERLDNWDHYYIAEDFHQRFAEENPDHPYVRMWAAPKVDQVREAFPEKVR